MIKVDNVKRISDDLGQPRGDLGLPQLAGLVVRLPRSADRVTGYGGAELALMLPATPHEDAVDVRERLISNEIAEHDGRMRSDLCADARLRASKRAGRN